MRLFCRSCAAADASMLTAVAIPNAAAIKIRPIVVTCRSWLDIDALDDAVVRSQDLHLAHLCHPRLVDVRHDGLLERPLDLPILARAIGGTRRRQHVAVHETLEGGGLGAV